MRESNVTIRENNVTTMNFEYVVFTTSASLSLVLLGLHYCAIYVCFASKELQKLRFLQLALFLSLSDCILGVGFLTLSLRKIILHFLGKDANGFECILLLHLLSGTVVSSLLQTLLICIERFHATFTIKRNIFTNLTGNVSVGLCVVIPHCLALVRALIEEFTKSPACDFKYTISELALFTHDIPVAILVISICVIYGIIISRIVKHQKTFPNRATTLSEAQLKRQKSSTSRMRKNIVTLGCIIGVAIISALPRTVLGFYVYFGGSFEIPVPLMVTANGIFMMLNPLFDPVIYILRIEKYRELIKSKCRCFNKRTVEAPKNTTST